MTNCPEDTPLADDIPPPTRLNNTSPPPTPPRTPASTRVVWLTFCSATPTRRM
jgi:hypothetical protein